MDTTLAGAPAAAYSCRCAQPRRRKNRGENPLTPATALTLTIAIVTFLASYSDTVRWSVAQLARSLCLTEIGSVFDLVDSLERSSWSSWENNPCNGTQELRSGALDVPMFDVASITRCDGNGNDAAPRSCRRNVSDLPALIRSRHGDEWMQSPLLLRNLWTGAELRSPDRNLSLTGFADHATISSLTLPYFVDATRREALKPDSTASLADILKNVTSVPSFRGKIASQLIVESHPELIEEVAPSEVVTVLFGDRFKASDLVPGRFFPAQTTVPIFLAGAKKETQRQCLDANEGACPTDDGRGTSAMHPSSKQSTLHPRTDLHCEPIGNVAVQLSGSKRWTLISPSQSFQLRPAVSREGRAYFFSMLDQLDPAALSNVPHYEVVTREGDGLWVPPWMWHRVDYAKGEESEDDTADFSSSASLAASLFHFRPMEYAKNNPLFAALIVPNLIKEVLGWNTE